METTLNNNEIKWRQVWSLVALDVAIIISWIAYHKFQPELLQQFNFEQYTLFLKIVQGVILLITPPLAGMIADRIRRKNGSRLPVINVGISVVSMVFMAVAFTVWSSPGGLIRSIFPLMIVLWLVSMNIFHSPAISTVELFVPPQKLPQVMALFVVVSGLAEAIEPSVVDIVRYFGAPLTFGMGGILVFFSGYWLQKETKNLTVHQEDELHSGYAKIETSNFGVVVMLGVGVGLFTALFFEIFPIVAEKNISFVDTKGFKGTYFVSILVAFSALLSLPLSRWLENKNLSKINLIGFVGCAVLSLGIWFSPIDVLVLPLLLLFPIMYSIITVTSLPIAFLSLCQRNKVLGIGLFFSGVELVNSLMDIFQELNK